MPDENTPLIQVVAVAPPRQRYNHSLIRRFCTIALGSTLIVIVVLFLIPFTWLKGPHRHKHGHEPPPPDWHAPYPHDNWPGGYGLEYEELEKHLLHTPSPKRLRADSEYYTSGPHLAGKNLSQAIWTKEKWEKYGVKSEIVAYDVYINYPKDHRLALLEKVSKSSAEDEEATKKKDKFKTLYEVNLEEDVLDKDPTSGLEDRIPTFHGYSANGNVTGRFVFVNFGTYWDFEDVRKANVSLEGKIALAKYGGNFRGLKVKRAQELGMIGVVMYSDPQEDGEVTELNGYKAYPEGPARNPSAVQRGSTQFLSVAPGDPTTPGYPSLPGAPRQDTSHAIPQIPSLPISYREALPILKALNGHGPKASEFNKYWQGGGLSHKGIKYNIGPSEAYLNLVNEQEYKITPLWNVIGIINGSIPDEVVIMGNHRDSWTASGAGDPNSGSAALNEVIRGFGSAIEKGWKPLRTLVFASWDGEEYGLIGSTEWVEQYAPWLSSSGVAYLNLDVGSRGPSFTASASPLLHKALYRATSRVQSPNQTVAGQTVGDLWNGHIGPMGSGSDFTAFQDFVGIPSTDMGFQSTSKSPVYHYHSNYDSFHWMDTFGDPEWEYHATITKVWALMAANLVETPIIALNTSDYANALVGYIQKAIDKAAESSIKTMNSYLFQNIQDAIIRLVKEAEKFDAHAEKLSNTLEGGVQWWNWWRKAKLFHSVRAVNAKYKYFERQFLYSKGLDSRPWFKHVIFAPGLWTGYSGQTMPGLLEALDDGNTTAVEKWSQIIERDVTAARKLISRKTLDHCVSPVPNVECVLDDM